MQFEGESVDGFTVTIRQYKGDLPVPLTAGETIELKVTVEVSAVNFNISKRNGRFYRDHILYVQEIEVP